VIKGLLPVLALLLATLSLLTIVRAPEWMWAWKLAVLATEFGHWLVVLPLLVILINATRPAGGSRTLTFVLCAVAVVCFLRPMISARGVVSGLPAEMDTAFGDTAPPLVLDWKRLYGHRPASTASMTTEIFARPDGQQLALDFYAPLRAEDEKHPAASPRRGAPCLVMIHGGGWDEGDRTQLAGWNAHWAARGYAVAAISYRLAPKWMWPAQREDALAAIAWLKANAARLGIDRERLVIFGRSAGGQIAAAVGYGARDPTIRGVVALYAPQDMPFTWSVAREDDAINSVKLLRQFLGGPPDESRRATYESASAQLLARPDTPPTLLIHGDLDTISWCRHSERLDQRLTELHVPHYFLRLPWATHGLDFNPNGPGGQLADYAIGRFLERVTR